MSPRKEVLGVDLDGPTGSGSGSGPGVDPGAQHQPGLAETDLSADPNGVLDPLAAEADASFEANLRPHRLAEFVGQAELRERLEIVLEAARRRGHPVDHVLFAGPPGLGKTTLAGIVAAEMGAGLRVTSGPALVRTGDVAAILTDLQEGDVLFIDEIHRLGRAVEEVLYPAMEDFQLDIVIGKGPTARSIRLDLPRFTLVGATTRTGLITGPLRDRFGFVARLEHYQPYELEEIVLRSGRLLKVELTPEGAREIASRSRGTPRLALRLLRRVRDFVEVRGEGVVTLEAAQAGLERFGVDELGLDRLDRMILETLCERFAGRPVGLSTLAVSVGEEPETVEDVYEPFLLKAGLLLRTPRGRLAAPAAYRHLGLAVPALVDALVETDMNGIAGGGIRLRVGRSAAPAATPALFDPGAELGSRPEDIPSSG
jgi:Holliday junction DNA helicase RuvB